MTTRLYTSQDYALVAEWWAGHGAEVVPLPVLPALGVFALGLDGEPLAVAWLYQDNSVGVAWVAWVTTKPGLSALVAVQALRVLMGGMEAAARAHGRGLLFTMTKYFGLGRWLERNGWVPNDPKSTQYFKPLPPEAAPPHGS